MDEMLYVLTKKIHMGLCSCLLLLYRVLSLTSRKNPGCGWSRGNVSINCAAGIGLPVNFVDLDDEILPEVGRKFLLLNGA